jgi:hypothetical protein
MITGPMNRMELTPIRESVRPIVYAGTLRYGYEVGHSRSRPAELDTTFGRRSAKPVAPTELPTDTTTTAAPLEPARAPVPGAIPS